jgi:hypothetical protein
MAVPAICLTGCNLPLDPGPPPRSTVIVITAEGPYATGFDDPADWLIGETEISDGRVEDGEYLLAIKQPSVLAWTHQQRVFSDGVYEFDARLDSGPEASGFGLLLLGSSDLSSFLYVMITGDGRYDVGTCADSCDEQQSLIGGYTLAYSILSNNQSNHLRLELANGTLNLTINGAPVSAVQGLTYSEGLVGFVGESSPYGGFVAAFDNLQVIEAGGTPTLEPTSSTPPTPALITVTPSTPELITATPPAPSSPAATP